ncbi:aspartic proteinase 36-like [Lycium ferocissimum]|uniref:aspartic proteinase 36-like n=1 Tax=Lycium ferocissimum TaxID=112874 RepID=UPI00281627EF|nr:aspartic proteinase 36-like [Lycium ferocissimum]
MVKEVQSLSKLRLSNSEVGGFVAQNMAYTSLVIEVREKQFGDSYLLQMKEGIHKHKESAFVQGGDGGIMRYRGRYCVPNVDGLRERIMSEAHNFRVLPMKGVIGFGKKGKHSPAILDHTESSERKCVRDPSLVIPTDSITVNDSLTSEKVPVKILDLQVHKLRTKKVCNIPRAKLFSFKLGGKVAMDRKFVLLVSVFCMVVVTVTGQAPVGANATTPPAASPSKHKIAAPAKAPSTATTILVVTAPISILPSKTPARVLRLERMYSMNQTVELEELIARDRARHARHRVVNFPVIGSSDPFLLGIYYTKVKLGSPPSEYKVVIDTGRDISWVTCSSCEDCPRRSGLGFELNFYDSASSSTASLIPCSDQMCSWGRCSITNQCAYTVHYEDMSGTTGFFVSDLLHLDTILGTSVIANSSTPFVFGCSTSRSGRLSNTGKAVDGIFGFGQLSISLISQLSAHGVSPNVFSHCLKGEGGGILVLGEILNPSMVYTPLVPATAHYNVNLQSITVNGKILPIDRAAFASSSDRGTIIDSGTTLAYLPTEAYDALVSAIAAAASPLARPIKSGERSCYLVSSSVEDMFPPVSLNFAGDVSMQVRRADYLYRMGSSEGAAMWCVLFDKSKGLTILGDLVVKDKIIVYDLARQRIGWADHDCSSPVNVSESSGKDKALCRWISYFVELMLFYSLFWS